MPRRAHRWLATLLPLLALAASPAPSGASSALEFAPCPGQAGYTCAQLPVPLDRAGGAPGGITLSVERKITGSGPSASAVVALAGGPGQPALPFAEINAQQMAPALHGRDLLVFDQRGTGSSAPLSCPALERIQSGTLAAAFASCAEQIGPARGGFTTQESVQDIEALRQAAGYQKLVLYGTSYGTKVALEYAESHPEHVEALVLDSVVPADGPEPFGIPSLEAIPAVVRELCTQGACAGITPEPLAELASLVARLRRRPMGGSVYDGLGHRHDTHLDELELLQVLEAGDLNPALRALLPAAIHSALRGDPDPLLRLQALSEGLVPNVPVPRAADGETDEALFVTTSCEEAPFPWRRQASSTARLAEALTYLHGQPASEFTPFDRVTALGASLVEACDAWPDASPAPPAPRALPNVPALILSGAQDLRTPVAQARRVAALIPDAQLVEVPFTGHSVLGSDLTGCAAQAVAAFFAGQPVHPCADVHDPLPPTPVTPTSLTSIHAPHALPGRAGRTLVAVLDTLLDLNRQVIAATLQADAQLPSGSSFGGLHGGYARLNSTRAYLHGLSLVPGVRLTATFPVHNRKLGVATIRISGAGAAAGTVRVGAQPGRVTGRLGGHSFDLSLARVKLARAAPSGWPVTAPLRRGVDRSPAPAFARLR